MKVDEIIKKIGMTARTHQDQRGTATVSLTPDECGYLLAEIAVLRAQYELPYIRRQEVARRIRQEDDRC